MTKDYLNVKDTKEIGADKSNNISYLLKRTQMLLDTARGMCDPNSAECRRYTHALDQIQRVRDADNL